MRQFCYTGWLAVKIYRGKSMVWFYLLYLVQNVWFLYYKESIGNTINHMLSQGDTHGGGVCHIPGPCSVKPTDPTHTSRMQLSAGQLLGVRKQVRHIYLYLLYFILYFQFSFVLSFHSFDRSYPFISPPGSTPIYIPFLLTHYYSYLHFTLFRLSAEPRLFIRTSYIGPVTLTVVLQFVNGSLLPNQTLFCPPSPLPD